MSEHDDNNEPPAFANWLLTKLVSPGELEELQGDLLELFNYWVKQDGVTSARRRYLLTVLKLFRPFFRRRVTPNEGFDRPQKYDNIYQAMIQNYFKIAWRNLSRNRGFTILNVLGLSLGMTCVILIFKIVTFHFSFDDFHSDTDRIYRVVSEFRYEDVEYQKGVPQPLGKALANDFSFADQVARVKSYRTVMVSLPDEPDEKRFQEENLVAFAEPAFFDIFNFPLVSGGSTAILGQPNVALVTRTMARKYFNTEDAVGKLIRISLFDKQVDFKVGGVLQDIPENTDRREQVYLSYSNLKDFNAWVVDDRNWGGVNGGMQCFVLLKSGVGKAQVDEAFPTLVRKYYDDEDERITVFSLQPLSDIHFNVLFGGTIRKSYLWILSLTGFFLIATACVNFVNLATAQAINRSKEVGIRKVLGSKRWNLFLQFMTETFLIAMIAVIISCVMSRLTIPYLNNLFQIHVTLGLFGHWKMTAFIILTLVLVVFFAGAYPGLVLSRFQPVLALKGKLHTMQMGGFSLRRILIVAQFSLCQVLIVGMIVISAQMHYSRTSDLGFTKESIVMLPIPLRDRTKMKTLAGRLSTIPGIEKVALCFEAPASGANSFTGIRFDNREKDEPWEINLKEGDDQYVPTFELRLVSGRNLLPSDTTREFLVNETFFEKSWR